MSKRIVLSIALLFNLIIYATAQEAKLYQTKPLNIFEALSSHSEKDGTIIIRQPQELKALVGKVSQNSPQATDSKEAIALRVGYRIQAYNGNLPASKQEAYRRAAAITKAFPGNVCYITYKAPFWRLLVGDYQTMEEARAALATLKSVASNFANELYIVNDKIRSDR